ncbi:hypothetical protein [Pannonibacter phragmitetus]|nr:hypothetical protein [Pannonibacter phragmitetus]
MSFKKTIAAAFTTAGSMGTAAANFLLAAVLIPRLAPADYGGYSFALVAIQLGFNISNALTATPMSMDIAQGRLDTSRLNVYGTVSLMLCSAMVALVFVNLFFNNIVLLEALLLGVAAFTALLRWYGRTYCFNAGRRSIALQADIAYTVALTGGAAFLFLEGSGVTLIHAALALLIANVLSSITFIQTHFFSSFTFRLWKGIREYVPVFRENAFWALILVVLSEAAVNAHVYLVTYSRGLEAYAPLALALLFWRPVSTVISAVGQSERPKIAKLLNESNSFKLNQHMMWFRMILVSAFLLNLLVVILFIVFLGNIWLAKFPQEEIFISVCIASGMMLCRVLRVPDTVYCQASGDAKRVAKIAWIAAPASIVVTALFLFNFELAALSMFGVLVGDAILLFGTRWVAKNKRRSL